MKSSLFERILLLSILIAAIYIIYLLSNPPRPLKAPPPQGSFLYLHSASDTTTSDGTPVRRDPKLYDTLLIPYNEISSVNNPCECCPTMYMMSYTSSDSSIPGGKGPKILMKVDLSALSGASDSTPPTPKEPKIE